MSEHIHNWDVMQSGRWFYLVRCGECGYQRVYEKEVKRMKFNELTREIAEKEGLKTQVGMGNIREVVRLVMEAMAQDPIGAMEMITKYAKRRR